MPNRNGINWSSVCKVACTALPTPVAYGLVGKWKHLARHKGSEFLANRIKVLWNAALLGRDGSHKAAADLLRSNRIAVRQGGTPVGPEGYLVKRFLECNKPSAIRRVAAVLRLYTTIVLPEASSSQLLKCKKSINSPGPRFSRGGPKGPRTIASVDAIAHLEDVCDESKLKPASVAQMSGTSAYPHLGKLGSFKKKPYASLMASLGTKGVVPNSLVEFWEQGRVDQSVELLRLKAEVFQNEANDPTFGKIIVLQEKGAKGRVICSPNAWVQLYLKPFHDALLGVIKRVESSAVHYGLGCMFQQERGIDAVLAARREGRPAYCVDLSSATDRFPLLWQQIVAAHVGLPTLAMAFQELKGPYRSPDGDVWEYAAGQPMGCYGSFPLFHLSHYAMLCHCCEELLLPKAEVNFCVLGDDVVIFNKELLKLYRNTLARCGVDISEHKSFNGEVTEFAGFLSLPGKSGHSAFRPYKWGSNGKLSSVLNVCHALGRKVTTWSAQWRKAYELYQDSLAHRRLDLTPLVGSEDASFNTSNKVDARYLSSLVQELSYLADSAYDVDFDSLHTEFHLLQQQVEGWDLQYEGNVPRTVFDPQQYVVEETERKAQWQLFYKDPLIITVLGQSSC